MLGFERFGQFDPVRPAAQPHIHDRQIEAPCADSVERFAAVAGLAFDLKIGLRIKQLHHPFAKEWMIIHQKDASLSFLGFFSSGRLQVSSPMASECPRSRRPNAPFTIAA